MIRSLVSDLLSVGSETRFPASGSHESVPHSADFRSSPRFPAFAHVVADQVLLSMDPLYAGCCCCYRSLSDRRCHHLVSVDAGRHRPHAFVNSLYVVLFHSLSMV